MCQKYTYSVTYTKKKIYLKKKKKHILNKESNKSTKQEHCQLRHTLIPRIAIQIDYKGVPFYNFNHKKPLLIYIATSK